jgi:hypothetical protein
MSSSQNVNIEVSRLFFSGQGVPLILIADVGEQPKPRRMGMEDKV